MESISQLGVSEFFWVLRIVFRRKVQFNTDDQYLTIIQLPRVKQSRLFYQKSPWGIALTVGKVFANDRDSIEVLPLSIVPLKINGLRKARIVKNSRLEGVVELFSERESGSGQIRPHDLPKVFCEGR